MTPGPASEQAKIVTSALADEIVQNTKLHLNLAQDTIIITEDKVRLCLISHVQRVEARNRWVAPAGVLITILTTLSTTTFREFYFDAPTWRAIYVIAAILSVLWLIRSVADAWRSPTIADIVAEMKRVGNESVSSGAG